MRSNSGTRYAVRRRWTRVTVVVMPRPQALRHHCRRANGTKSQTIDSFDSGIIAVQFTNAARLTGFGTAEFNYTVRQRRCPVIMIKTHHAVHFGARQIEGMRNRHNSVIRDMTESGLHIIQDRKQRPFAMTVRRKNIRQFNHQPSRAACQRR